MTTAPTNNTHQAITQQVIDTLQVIERAGWKLLGTARDMPGDVEALAHALHDAECGCRQGPDHETWARASGLVQGGWRRSGPAELNLANLLAEIGQAYGAMAGCPVSTAERDRWTPVVDLAASVANEVTR